MQLLMNLNQYRRVIFALLLLALIIAMVFMPTMVVEAGKPSATVAKIKDGFSGGSVYPPRSKINGLCISDGARKGQIKSIKALLDAQASRNTPKSSPTMSIKPTN